MASQLDKSIDLKHYLRIMWRRKGVVLVCTVSLVCAAVITLSLIPEQYSSRVTLMIQDRQPLAYELEQIMGGMGPPKVRYDVDKERLSQLAGRVRSRPFLENVIRIARMHEDPAVREQARKAAEKHGNLTVDEMTIRLLVQSLKGRIRFVGAGPGLYQIIVTDLSPRNAQLLAKWTSELFVDFTIQNALERMRMTREFGAEQLRIYEDELRRSEEALERYRGTLIEAGLAQRLVREDNVALADLLHARLSDEAETARSRVRPFLRAVIQAGFDSDDRLLRADAETEELIRRMTAVLERAVTDRLTVVQEEEKLWPPRSAGTGIRQELYERLEENAERLYPNAGPEGTRVLAQYAFARIDSEIQEATLGYLDQLVQSYKRQAQSVPEDEMKVAHLQKAVNEHRELLESFRAQMVASDVSRAVESTKLGLQIEILDPAELPLKPSYPNRNKILLAALFMGPLLGAALAFLSETADATLRSLDDIRQVFPEPILATTPLLSSMARRNKGLRRHWVPAAVTGVLLLTIVFFAARITILADAAAFGRPVQVVDPDESASP